LTNIHILSISDSVLHDEHSLLWLTLSTPKIFAIKKKPTIGFHPRYR